MTCSDSPNRATWWRSKPQSQTLHVYAIYAYIRVVWGVNVGIYGIHGVSGNLSFSDVLILMKHLDP